MALTQIITSCDYNIRFTSPTAEPLGSIKFWYFNIFIALPICVCLYIYVCVCARACVCMTGLCQQGVSSFSSPYYLWMLLGPFTCHVHKSGCKTSIINCKTATFTFTNVHVCTLTKLIAHRSCASLAICVIPTWFIEIYSLSFSLARFTDPYMLALMSSPRGGSCFWSPIIGT